MNQSVSNFITVMQRHIGRENAISGKRLSEALQVNDREMRKLTDHAIEEGIALCSHPAYGYWVAKTPDELEETCRFHRSRALHELQKEARLKKLTLADLLGQLHLGT